MLRVARKSTRLVFIGCVFGRLEAANFERAKAEAASAKKPAAKVSGGAPKGRLQIPAKRSTSRAPIAAYCVAYGRWRTAEKALAAMASLDPVTSGLLIKTSNGNAIQNPLVG